MGARGPVPKRSTERRRRNKEAKPEQVQPLVASVAAPKPNARWHPLAKDWFVSLGESGQARFFEPSDWQAARYVAEMLSRQLREKRPSAQFFQSIWSAMSDLLTTEAARRRVRIEVDRDHGDPEQPAGVTALADYRKALDA
jgi:hypothetical protein